MTSLTFSEAVLGSARHIPKVPHAACTCGLSPDSLSRPVVCTKIAAVCFLWFVSQEKTLCRVSLLPVSDTAVQTASSAWLYKHCASGSQADDFWES